MNNYVWTGKPIYPLFRVVTWNDSAIIDFTEASYDLETAHDDWLRKLVSAGAPFLDHGLGVFALDAIRPSAPGPLVFKGLHVFGGPPELEKGIAELQSQVDLSLLWPISRAGVPKTLSEVTQKYDPAVFRAIMEHFGFCRDALGLSVLGSDGKALYLVIALPTVTTLSAKARERWHMLAAHFGAGHRLRCALVELDRGSAAETGLPWGAEAVIDPKGFHVADAAGEAESRSARDALRDAARLVDAARGKMRQTDPDKALELWKALVRGRWSTIDWFDSDGRRYVLGIPNAPDVLDPRGLTQREMQVVSYAVLGLTSKLIAYHLGISTGRVSTLLNSAMRKLGVNTKAELIKKLADFGSQQPA